MDVFYVSMTYATAVHLCPGCERKVVTPFASGSWYLIFDGETVSIRPSIRNNAHECGTHYWIDRDRIVPAWDAYELDRQYPPSALYQRERQYGSSRWTDRLRRIGRRLRN